MLPVRITSKWLVRLTFETFLLAVCSIVDESPRWLLQQNRSKQAYVILQRAFRLNKAKINGDLSKIVEKIALVSVARSALYDKLLLMNIHVTSQQ